MVRKDHVPHFGFTRHGHPVHLRTADYHPAATPYQRFNKKLALKVTSTVGTMTCAYAFSLIALVSLPAVLTQAFHLGAFPSWLVAAGLVVLVSWVAQTYIQLVLLSVIMVGQGVTAEAGDIRAAKTFEDAEELKAQMVTALDKLDEHTEGGIKAVLDALASGNGQPGAKNLLS